MQNLQLIQKLRAGGIPLGVVCTMLLGWALILQVAVLTCVLSMILILSKQLCLTLASMMRGIGTRVGRVNAFNQGERSSW